MRQGHNILKKMSVGDILDYSIEIYKKNFKQLTILTLIGWMPVALLMAYASAKLVGGQFGLFSGIFNGSPNLNTEDFQTNYWFFIVLSYVSRLVLLINIFTVGLAMDAGIVRIVYSSVLYGITEKAIPNLKYGFKKLGWLILNRLIFFLIVYGVTIVIVIAVALIFVAFLFALGYGETLGNRGASEGLLIGIMIFAYIIALLGATVLISYFTLRLVFGIHIIAIENGDFGKSISRSWSLTKGNFWYLFASFICAFIIFMVIPGVLNIGAFGLMAVNKSIFVIGYISTQLISSILYPFLWIVLTLLFINLKIKKEGLDLELKVDELIKESERQDIISEDGEAENA